MNNNEIQCVVSVKKSNSFVVLIYGALNHSGIHSLITPKPFKLYYCTTWLRCRIPIVIEELVINHSSFQSITQYVTINSPHQTDVVIRYSYTPHLWLKIKCQEKTVDEQGAQLTKTLVVNCTLLDTFCSISLRSSKFV